MSCGVACRHGPDPALLCLWHMLVATAPIRPLAWEPPYAAGVALEKTKRKEKKRKKKKQAFFEFLDAFDSKRGSCVQ